MKYGGFENEIYAGDGWKDFASVYSRWLVNGSHDGGNECRGILSLVDNNDPEDMTANAGLGGSSMFCSSFLGGRRTAFMWLMPRRGWKTLGLNPIIPNTGKGRNDMRPTETPVSNKIATAKLGSPQGLCATSKYNVGGTRMIEVAVVLQHQRLRNEYSELISGLNSHYFAVACSRMLARPACVA